MGKIFFKKSEILGTKSSLGIKAQGGNVAEDFGCGRENLGRFCWIGSGVIYLPGAAGDNFIVPGLFKSCRGFWRSSRDSAMSRFGDAAVRR